MRTLLFLSRVAVLLNVMFLLFIMGRYGLLPVENSYLNGLIITVGWGISFIVNLLLQPVLFVVILIKRLAIPIPAWILVFNFFCFVFQLFFFFFTS